MISEAARVPNRDKQFQPGAGGPKKSNPLTLVLTIALCLLLVLGLARMFLKPPAQPLVQVVAAAKDIAPGCRLGFTTLHYLNIPKRYWSPEMVTSFEQVVGRVTNTYIGTGEPILKAQLLPGTNSLSPTIGFAQRAITLKLDEAEMVDHSILPMDRIDVIATTTGAEGKKFTKTICQNMLVLMAAPKSMLFSDKLRSMEQNKVTLAANPEDAEKLAQAAETAKLRLILRNPANHVAVELPGADERDILPHDALHVTPPMARVERETNAQLLPPPLPPAPFLQQAAQIPAATAQWIVQVFKGSKKEENAFPQ